MTKSGEMYKCEICGNLVSVLEEGAGELVCCEQPMTLLVEKTGEEEGKEKHVPVIEEFDGGIRVKVGSVPHPMEDKHHIELIQLMKNKEVVVGKRLKPGEEPIAEFCIVKSDGLSARALCNVHGLWID